MGADLAYEGGVADGGDDELISAGRDAVNSEGSVVMGDGPFGGAVQEDADAGDGFAGGGVPDGSRQGTAGGLGR